MQMKKNISLVIVILLLVSSIFVLAQEETDDSEEEIIEIPEEEIEEIELEVEEEAGIPPDSIIYGLDRAFERISLALTFDRAKKAEKRLKIASERIAELKVMVKKGKPEFAEKLAKEHNEELEKAENDIEKAKALGKNVTALREHVAEMTYKHVIVLQRVLEKVPEQAKVHIQNAIEKSQKGNEIAIANIEKETGKPAKVPKISKKPEKARGKRNNGWI